MLTFFKSLNPIYQTLIATSITYLFTVLGSALVFCFKKVNKNFMDAILGMAGGVMLSAVLFSLINPALEFARDLKQSASLVLSIGIMLGGLLLFITDKISDKVLSKYENKSSKKRIFMLLFSITIHNIPEGLVVGLAFGNIIYGGSTVDSAIMLALGIAIQNFPEGSALSIPMKREGISTFKSFFLGQISGIVEPIAGIIGVILSLKIKTIMPLMLSFAGGAMIYVVVEEIIPESQTNKKKSLMALFTLIGFILMMILDIM